MPESFNSIFNKRLGSKTGSIAKRPSPLVFNVDRAAADERASRASLFEAMAAINEERARNQAQARSSSPTGEALDPILGNFNQPAVDLITESDGFSVGGAFKDLGSNLLDVGSRGIDVISRPYYGLMESMKEASESLNEGQSTIGSVDDIVGGAWSGFSGREKTGFGEVVEENANRDPGSGNLLNYLVAPTNLIGEGLNNEEVPDWVSKWGKRTLGLGGELFLDPLNYVGVGLVGKMGKTGARAIDYTDDAFRALTKDATEKAIKKSSVKIDSLLDNPRMVMEKSPLGGSISKWTTVRNILNDTADKAIDDAVLQINKRGSSQAAGRVIGAHTAPSSVSKRIASTIESQVYRNFDEKASTFLEFIDGSRRLNAKQLNSMRESDELFDKFINNLMDEINLGRPKNKITDPLDAVRAVVSKPETSAAFRSKVTSAIAETKSSYDDVIRNIQKDIFNAIDGELYNAPGLRVGKEVKSIPGLDRVGRAYADFRNTRLSGDAASAFSHAKQFKDRSALMTQRIRSLGIRRYEEFHKEVKKIATQLSKAERKELSQAILNGTDFSDPRMQKAKDFIQEHYERMFQEEVDAGVREAVDLHADNYVYNYFRKGNRDDIGDIRKGVKRAVRDNNALPPDIINMAKSKGLRPTEDAFEALLLRQIKSNRDLSRAWFTRDLLDHYGVQSNRLSEKAASSRGLKRISSSVPSDIKRNLKEGDEWYLPKDIERFLQRFRENTTMGYSADTAAFLRMIDKVTRMFKASATVYYPGFHVRNSIGDMYMSFLDGVRTSDYSYVLDMMRRNRAAKNGTGKPAVTQIGGRNFTYEELKDIFRKNASSGGFYNTDLGVDQIAAKANPNKFNQIVRQGSENREDFFRFAHFMKAFKEEYPNAVKTVKDPNKALRNAVEASTYRVNKSLFDYGALTRTEKNVLRRAIPFYTYSRKVMPTLLEAMMLKPSMIGRADRFFSNSNDSQNFDDMLIPDYLREYGYARLTDEENPWVLGSQFLPTTVLEENTGFGDDQRWFANLLSQTNPLIKTAVERGTGVQTFNEAPVDPQLPSYMAQSWLPFIRPTEDLVSTTDTGRSILEKIPGLDPSNKTKAEAAASGRFTLGLPFDKISESQQTSALYGLEDKLFGELEKINEKLSEKNLRLRLSKRGDSASYRVYDNVTDEVLVDTQDINEAVKLARQLADNR